ncbi:MAG: ribonuclease III [Clostridiales Family XIII bacterium]|jgi:ribonuclease-3|nr:ribonuclease III [Clostridiales Family XIII bacterium]
MWQRKKMTEQIEFRGLQKIIRYRFRDRSLLENALMHTSYVNEQGMERIMSNQRLEYLGDAVIELVVTDIIFDKLPNADEGLLTQLRSQLVCTAGLARVARSIGLGNHLVLGKGAEMTGERDNPTILEDAFEALSGAIYLDGGWKKADAFVRNAMQVSILNAIDDMGGRPTGSDRKSALQIALQKKGQAHISYRVAAAEGPAHDRTFYVDVYASGKMLGSGVGSSKKEAEQDAAGKALDALSAKTRQRRGGGRKKTGEQSSRGKSAGNANRRK